MINDTLIAILADGKLHSGQGLARDLGISRTAVWKQLAQLKEYGLNVRRLKGQGYCLSKALDLLDTKRIADQIPSSLSERLNIQLFSSLPSTNEFLSNSPSPPERFSVCLAEQQTAGRGRRGRVWLSPFGSNLYMSLAFDSARGVAGLDGLSLVVGLALAKSLKRMGLGDVKLKWPNDLWLSERKLAGVLIELSGELQTRCRVVVGVGLNVYMKSEDGIVIDQPWTSLAEHDAVPEGGRNQLTGWLLSDLMASLEELEEHGFLAFRHEWEEFDALRGRILQVVGTQRLGVGAGIDQRGAYRLQTDDGELYLNAGEVSVRASSAP